MNNELKSAIDTFVESFGNFGENLGISKVVAQLYALLYLSSEPLSLDDMCEFLKISKGNTSMNIRYLERWDAVKKIWIKGSRKDYYKVNPDITKIIMNRLKIGLNRRFEDFMRNMDNIEKLLDISKGSTVERKKVKVFRKRIKEIKDLHSLLNKISSITEKILI
jgi:DNA-binding transcriptional regulator GbsR (MarR family)